MSVNNNNPSVFNTWATDLQEGIALLHDVNQNVSTIQTNLNNIIAENLSPSAFQAAVNPIIEQMDAYIESLKSQYPDIAGTPLVVANLSASWQATLQTFAPTIPNPNYPANSSDPTISIKYSPNGSSASVSFSAPYNHNAGNVYLNGVTSPAWLPNQYTENGYHTTAFGYICAQADQNKGVPKTFNWSTHSPPEMITVTVDPKNLGMMDVTVKISGDTSIFGASMGNVSTSALSNFLSNLN